MAELLRFDTVTKRYPNGHEGVRGISFSLAAGEMVFLTGHSGAGKSTILKLISRIETATVGKVLFAGQNLAKLDKHSLPYFRRQIGLVMQTPCLLSHRNIFDNVALPLVIQGIAHHELQRKVRAALDKLGLLRYERCYPDELSGGEQQRVAIARAIVSKPQLILADEPTGNVDPDLAVDIMQIFADFNSVGVSVLVATHDWQLVERFAYRTVSLRAGMLINQAGEKQHVGS